MYRQCNKEEHTKGHAVEKLHERLLAISGVDDDGVYRDGASKRVQRSELVLGSLKRLWDEALASLDFEVPTRGVGLAAVGSLARGQMGP
ncbi:MAG: protein-PII uridylyltransferase, partial [Bifidobacterium crudilactis]|nr:protein-PII uridylyltransferase [Bifidobacterium crudilactis]